MINLENLGTLVNTAVQTRMVVVTYNDVNRYSAGIYTPAPNLRMEVVSGGGLCPL